MLGVFVGASVILALLKIRRWILRGIIGVVAIHLVPVPLLWGWGVLRMVVGGGVDIMNHIMIQIGIHIRIIRIREKTGRRIVELRLGVHVTVRVRGVVLRALRELARVVHWLLMIVARVLMVWFRSLL